MRIASPGRNVDAGIPEPYDAAMPRAGQLPLYCFTAPGMIPLLAGREEERRA